MVIQMFIYFQKHEDFSLEMFDHMIEDNQLQSEFHLYKLKRQDINFIKALITGKDQVIMLRANFSWIFKSVPFEFQPAV